MDNSMKNVGQSYDEKMFHKIFTKFKEVFSKSLEIYKKIGEIMGNL